MFFDNFFLFLSICVFVGFLLLGLTIWLYKKAKYRSAIICGMGSVFSIFSLPFLPIILGGFYYVWGLADAQNLKFIMSVEAADGKGRYALYESLSGFDDLNWIVYLMPPGFEADALDGQAPTHFEEYSEPDQTREYVVLWNWSEGANFLENPEIEILDGRFLVMRRGGLLHGVYDISNEEEVFNESSPWHVYQYGSTAEEDWAINPTTEGYDTFEDWYRVEMHDCMARFLEDPDSHSRLCGDAPRDGKSLALGE